MFPKAKDVKENPGILTWTSRNIDGGKGERESDYEGVMGVFASKAKDI